MSYEQMVRDLLRYIPDAHSTVPCPACPRSSARRLLWRQVVHLNDNHHWAREQIADWLDTLDLDLTINDESAPGQQPPTTTGVFSGVVTASQWQQMADYIKASPYIESVSMSYYPPELAQLHGHAAVAAQFEAGYRIEVEFVDGSELTMTLDPTEPVLEETLFNLIEDAEQQYLLRAALTAAAKGGVFVEALEPITKDAATQMVNLAPNPKEES